MEMSIREFKAKISAAVAAVERGEEVVITKHGKIVAEMIPARAKKCKLNFEALDAYLKEQGLDDIEVELPDYFDDTVYSRKVLGLED
ncbi:type II toxin-antitoxin system prevent-host-death family antitoxin [Novosphingobium sp.]|uniref:type II toxin-antitoxin system Phd/YefM family antitoxin n=1 Tax=Novosphingobium sp. TaxID=1874826 RepID=UPI00286B61A2|nr:type II toxin-antitoxin system prevent-host-death family antitoxin [Novosphingobium sp.]